MADKDCVFCKIARGEIPPGKGKVAESDNFLAFLDLNPKTEGHTLIIPKKHYVTTFDMPNKLGNELLKMIKDVSSDLLDKKLGDGFNIIQNNLEVAGQVVMHVHFHILPRKEEDDIKIIS